MSEIVANEVRPITCEKHEFRDSLKHLEKAMAEFDPDFVEPAVSHHFAPGMYGREMIIPADTAIIGKIHKHSHINVISKGIIEVATEFGIARYEAPCTFVSEAGTKRCVHAITETVWTTIHATESTDLEEIEKEVIAEDYENLLGEDK